MAAKSDRYSAKESVDDLEALSERLTADLRKHIRAMVRHDTYFICNQYFKLFSFLQGNFPILSDQWCEMADVLGRIAHVSEMVRIF